MIGFARTDCSFENMIPVNLHRIIQPPNNRTTREQNTLINQQPQRPYPKNNHTKDELNVHD